MNAESLDAFETDTAASVQARVMMGFLDEGNRRKQDSYSNAKRLTIKDH
jgi:hypothetical protein